MPYCMVTFQRVERMARICRGSARAWGPASAAMRGALRCPLGEAGAVSGDVQKRQEDQKTEKGSERAQGPVAQAQDGVGAPPARQGGKASVKTCTKARGESEAAAGGAHRHQHAGRDGRGPEKHLRRARSRSALNALPAIALSTVMAGLVTASRV